MLEFPKKRITINLAPAELPKDGAHYDLPIALSILCVSDQLRQHELDDAVFAGELALEWRSQTNKRSHQYCRTCQESLDLNRLFLPMANVSQASLIDGIEIYRNHHH